MKRFGKLGSATILSVVVLGGIAVGCREMKIDPEPYYWGPEVGSPLLRMEARNTENESSFLEVRACKASKFQNNPVNLSLLTYRPSLNQKSNEGVWFNVPIDADGFCTEWRTAALFGAFEQGDWLKLKVTSPSGVYYDECPNEGVCSDPAHTEPDNVYDTTALQMEAINNGKVTFGQQAHYWGPEYEPKVLRLETTVAYLGQKLGVRACTGEGAFINPTVDMNLWWYDPVSKVKDLLAEWDEVPVNGACTEWRSVDMDLQGLAPGNWIQLKVVSPGNTYVDECANEIECADPANTKPDNVYRTTALRIIE